MYSHLSLDQAPPLSVPVRFFLSAPVFGVMAAITLFAFPEAMANRWSAQMLAITHLLTLGVLTMVMFGALLQMLPVLAGSPVPHVKAVSTAVHLLLVIGVLCLTAGLMLNQTVLGEISLAALTGAVVAFAVAVGLALLRAPRPDSTVLGMRLALLALLVTLVLGMVLLAGHLWPAMPLYRPGTTGIHVAWGVLGWVGLLITAVAYQVVPMFQMTPPYATRVKSTLAPLLLALLTGWSLLQFWWPGPARLVGLGLAAGYGLFAVYSMQLQNRRRRRIADVTLDFWRLGLSALAAAALIWVAAALGLMPEAWQANREMMLGVLMIVVFALSIVNGMLYKILPFLVWFHLQGQAAGDSPPRMRQVIPVGRMRWQFRCHLAACLLAVVATVLPQYFTRPAAAAMGVSFLLLEYNLVAAYRLYVAATRRIDAAS